MARFSLACAFLALAMATANACKMVADVVYLVDSSNSIGVPAWTGAVKPFFKAVTKELEPGVQDVRVGIVQFSWGAYDVLLPSVSESDIDAAIDSMPFKASTTDMYRGYKKSWKMLEANPRPDAGKVVIMMTDGAPTGKNAGRTMWAADQLKKRGIRLIIVGVGPEVNQAQCKAMASRNVDTGVPLFIYADSFEAIAKQIPPIIGLTCDPPPKPIDPTKPACTELSDIVFVLDNSGSIPTATFPGSKKFLINALSNMNIGPVRTALLSWNSVTNVLWGLDDFAKCADHDRCPVIPYPGTKEKMVDILQKDLVKEEGTTNAEEALRWTLEVLKQRKKRQGAKEIIIFLSDGYPNLVTEWADKDKLIAKRFIEDPKLAVTKAADEYVELSKEFPEATFVGIGIGGVLRKWMKNLATFTGKTLKDQGPSIPSLYDTKGKDMKRWKNSEKDYIYAANYDVLSQKLATIVGKACVQANPSFNEEEDLVS